MVVAQDAVLAVEINLQYEIFSDGTDIIFAKYATWRRKLKVEKLTKKQESVYKFIRLYHLRNMMGPSYRTIAKHFGITARGAYDHVRLIKRKGRLKKFLQYDQGNVKQKKLDNTT